MIKILVCRMTSVGFLITTGFVGRAICFRRDLAELRGAALRVLARTFVWVSGKADGDGPGDVPASIPIEKSEVTSRVALGRGEMGLLGTTLSAACPEVATDIVPLRGSIGPTSPVISAARDRRGTLSGVSLAGTYPVGGVFPEAVAGKLFSTSIFKPACAPALAARSFPAALVAPRRWPGGTIFMSLSWEF
jgi:hypothetical protein